MESGELSFAGANDNEYVVLGHDLDRQLLAIW